MSIGDMTTKCSIEVEVFDYDQLPDSVKKRLLQEESESLAEIWQCDHLVEEFKELLEEIGFMEPKVWYSGFGSQGDGACFDADVDFEKVCKHLGITCEDGDEWVCEVLKINHHYSHERARRIELNNGGIADDVVIKLEAQIEELRLKLCKDFYKLLEDDYGYQTSEETCLEGLRSRGYALSDPIEEVLAKEAQYEMVILV